jgi:hypothetical protein
MSQSSNSASVNAVLARFDRSSPEKLLASLAAEIVRLGRENADLAARLLAVEQLQAVADRLLPAAPAKPEPLPQNVTIDATHSLLDSNGFYPLEFDATGNPSRWSGPGPQFSLPVFVDRTHGARFKLSFSRLAVQAAPSLLRCLLDGRACEISVSQTGGGVEVSGQMPARADQGASVLSFIVPGMAAAADQRPIGLCFQKLTLRANLPDDAAEPSRPRARAAAK